MPAQNAAYNRRGTQSKLPGHHEVLVMGRHLLRANRLAYELQDLAVAEVDWVELSWFRTYLIIVRVLVRLLIKVGLGRLSVQLVELLPAVSLSRTYASQRRQSGRRSASGTWRGFAEQSQQPSRSSCARDGRAFCE